MRRRLRDASSRYSLILLSYFRLTDFGPQISPQTSKEALAQPLILSRHRCKVRSVPKADICFTVVGDVAGAAANVRYRGNSGGRLDVDLLRNFDRVIDLDAEVSDCAFDLGMPKQELDSSQISHSPVDEHRFRPPQRVCAELRRVETDAGYPLQHQSRILPRYSPPLSPRPTKRNWPGLRPVRRRHSSIT